MSRPDFANFFNAFERAVNPTPEQQAERAARRQAEEARLRARAEAMAKAALGKTMTVRTGMNTTVTGPIVEAGFGRFRYTERSVQVVWKIIIKSGRAGTRHTFHVRSLPR